MLKRLTLTLDVFKSSSTSTLEYISLWLTLTLDVFKFTYNMDSAKVERD